LQFSLQVPSPETFGYTLVSKFVLRPLLEVLYLGPNPFSASFIRVVKDNT